MNRQRGSSNIGPIIGVLVFFGFIVLLILAIASAPTRHRAKIYRLRNHHIAMQDDKGKTWEYVLKGIDIDFDVPTSSTGRISLPVGGSWRAATEEETDEINTNNQDVQEDVSVSEGEDASVDGVSDGGDSGGGDSGDGGGDGGGGDGGE